MSAFSCYSNSELSNTYTFLTERFAASDGLEASGVSVRAANNLGVDSTYVDAFTFVVKASLSIPSSDDYYFSFVMRPILNLV